MEWLYYCFRVNSWKDGDNRSRPLFEDANPEFAVMDGEHLARTVLLIVLSPSQEESVLKLDCLDSSHGTMWNVFCRY
jgi:hypothetical protein